MSRLNEEQLERLRTQTVEVLLAVRAAYLATPGANALKHWDQIQNRLLSASRRSTTPDEWVTLLMRGLQLPAPSSSLSRSILDLGAAVRELGAASQWLDLLERETGLLMAMTRLAAEQRRAEREARETAQEIVDPKTGEVT